MDTQTELEKAAYEKGLAEGYKRGWLDHADAQPKEAIDIDKVKADVKKIQEQSHKNQLLRFEDFEDRELVELYAWYFTHQREYNHKFLDKLRQLDDYSHDVYEANKHISYQYAAIEANKAILNIFINQFAAQPKQEAISPFNPFKNPDAAKRFEELNKKQEAIDPETKNVFNYGYNEQEQTKLYLENQELKKILQATEGDAVEFAEWICKENYEGRLGRWMDKQNHNFFNSSELFKLFKNK